MKIDPKIKEQTMKKYNLTEQEWREVEELANLVEKCNELAIIPPPPFIF